MSGTPLKLCRPPLLREFPPMPNARFVGGMNVATKAGGRLNATMPLAVLTVDSTSLTLHPRSFPIPMFTDFRVSLVNIAAAFPLAGSPFASGVGIQLSDGQLVYFWTFRQDRVLAVLRQRGIPIDPIRRRAVGSLRGQFLWLRQRKNQGGAAVAELPGLSRPMMLAMPIGALVGLGIIVWFVSKGTPFGWFAGVAGALGLVNGARIWIASRKR